MSTQKAMDILLRLSTHKLREYADNTSKAELRELVDDLNAICVEAAKFSVYIDEYSDMGASHGEAVKKALTARRHVRKALGYSVPSAGEHKW